jgi:hypothetical protein
MLLMGALWLAPVQGVTAQAEEEVSESDEISPRGPGTVILLVGVGAVVVVGLAYWTRKDDSASTS